MKNLQMSGALAALLAAGACTPKTASDAAHSSETPSSQSAQAQAPNRRDSSLAEQNAEQVATGAESRSEQPAESGAKPEVRLRGFLVETCRRGAAKDAAWTSLHAELPLEGQTASKHEGRIVLSGEPARSVAGLAYLPTCNDEQLGQLRDDVQIREVRVLEENWFARVRVDGFDYALSLTEVDAGLRLRAFDFVLTPEQRALPAEAQSPPGYQVDGRILESEGKDAALFARFLRKTLQDDGRCMARHFETSHVSATMSVLVVKAADSPVRVEVKASTTSPAELIGCVQTQLDQEFNEVFTARAPSYTIRYHLMLSVPVPASEIDDDIPVLVGPSKGVAP